MKTILVCCGSGVATSPQVANKINEFLADHDLDNVAHAEPHPVETAKSRIDSFQFPDRFHVLPMTA